MTAIFQGYQGISTTAPASIASGQTVSAVIALNGFSLCGILLPAAFTGTTLEFLVSDSLGGSYVPLKNTTSGTALSYTVAQGTYVAIDPKDFYGVQFLQIVSGTTEGAARALTLSLKGF